MLADHLQKIKKEYKSLNKLEIQDIFTKKELDKAFFPHDMADGDFKDLKKEYLLMNFREIKHLILLKTLNMMDINGD